MVMLAVEITNLGPDKRAHGRERGAIVAVYGHKRQQMGRAECLFELFGRGSEHVWVLLWRTPCQYGKPNWLIGTSQVVRQGWLSPRLSRSLNRPSSARQTGIIFRIAC